ncbi:hypothetical protein [Streptomyces sp. Act143]|uniref:hypothetical protein n=1 Tax=Streptomyces sp. Act143 TaxID=2200760 RepID=UPI0011B5C804|nr:hypothetical protein [Streptomyces sp. Act143]
MPTTTWYRPTRNNMHTANTIPPTITGLICGCGVAVLGLLCRCLLRHVGHLLREDTSMVRRSRPGFTPDG